MAAVCGFACSQDATKATPVRPSFLEPRWRRGLCATHFLHRRAHARPRIPTPASPRSPAPQLDGGLRCEIAAHARWASALDLHPSRDLMASVSEDCSIAAWKLPITPGSGAAEGGGARRGADCSAPAPVLSAAALGRPLAGVAFCGEGCGDVAAAAYDGDDLLIWKGAGAA